MKKGFFLLLAAFACLPVFAQVGPSEMPVIPYKKVWVGIDAGYSYRIARAMEGMEDYVRDLRAGLFYGMNMHFALPRGFGLGARFTGHHYANKVGMIKDKVNTYYVAPSAQWRNLNRKGTGALVLGCSIGYLSFHEEIEYYSFDKGGIGGAADIGYDFRLSGETYLGIKLGLTGGFVDLGVTDSRGRVVLENLSAIDIGLGLRF